MYDSYGLPFPRKEKLKIGFVKLLQCVESNPFLLLWVLVGKYDRALPIPKVILRNNNVMMTSYYHFISIVDGIEPFGLFVLEF